jgi:hypothetical protein
MPLPVIANVTRCSMIGHMGTQEIVNVFHMRNPPATSPGAMAPLIGANWKTFQHTAGLFSSDLSWDSIALQPLDGVTPVFNNIPTGWPFVGAATADPAVPSSVAMIMTERTGVSGRSHRGRLYLAGVGQSNVDTTSTQWNPAVVTGYQSAASAFAAAFNGSDAAGDVLAVASYAHASSTDVTSVLIRGYFGTQRRRVD